RDPLALDWTAPAFAAARQPVVRAGESGAAAAEGQAHRGRPVVYVYSHAYDVRNRIHHDASYAMLPLFGAEAFLGERLYAYPTRTGTLRAWHNAVAISIYSLFA